MLVTGATGGLGRNAVEYLLARGHEVRATGRNAAVGAELVKAGADFMRVDLAAVRSELYPLVTGVDAVWHCAALSSPWGPYNDFYAANVYATQMLALAASNVGVSRFVHVSTPSLYFDYKHHRDIPETYRPRHYVNDYARTKAEAEACVKETSQGSQKMKSVILRPRGIFGRHDQALVPRIERVLVERGGRVPLPNGGKAFVDLTYAENVVHAMWLATMADGVESGTAFNITNGDPMTVADVLTRLFRTELGRPFEIKNVPYFALDTAARALEAIASKNGKEPLLTRYSAGALAYDMTLDISRARRQLGYEPVVSMEEGIARTANWMASRG